MVKRAPHHPPGIAPALGLRAGGDDASTLPQTGPIQETGTMSFTFLLRFLKRDSERSRTGQLRPRRPQRRPVRTRLGCERLEDRAVPSTLTVLNNLDRGAGSLRDAIAQAKS